MQLRKFVLVSAGSAVTDLDREQWEEVFGFMDNYLAKNGAPAFGIFDQPQISEQNQLKVTAYSKTNTTESRLFPANTPRAIHPLLLFQIGQGKHGVLFCVTHKYSGIM